ncbi:MAG: methionyl-tRNA formyltransferase [Nitrospirae bacterium]|jgi:methionyl-tRNA formyltransferase|nr:methionyl-tRNA formyltransferase [Nitrospirota bacterium]
MGETAVTDVSGIRTVFMGSPDFAVPFLSALVDRGFDLRGVVTQPDRPRGRGQALTPVPVRAWALEKGIPTVAPTSLRIPEGRQFLRDWCPDLIVVVAYGKILPEEVLAAPRWGCVNVHASLLPALRGASPIVWAIRNRLTVSGLSLMLLDRGMDTGPVLDRLEIPLAPDETSVSLSERMIEKGPEFLILGLERYLAGLLRPIPQPAEGSLAPILRKEDGRLPLESSALEVDAHVRAMNPWPGAIVGSSLGRLRIGSGRVLREAGRESVAGQVLSQAPEGIDVACGNGVYRIHSLQREGGRMLPVSEFLSGRRFAPGEILDFVPREPSES